MSILCRLGQIAKRPIKARNRPYCANQGQALIELAIFATIFLVVLSLFVRQAMSLNYFQQLQMSAFRSAQSEAMGLGYATIRSSSLVLVEDRRIPTTQGTFGISPRTPFSAPASLTWSEALNPESLSHDDSEVPRQKFIIDGITEKEYRTARQRRWMAIGQDNIENMTLRIKVDRGGAGPSWEWETINVYDYYNSEEKAIKYDIDSDGREDNIGLADVDNDGKDESITGVIGDFFTYGGREPTLTIYYLDPQEGELDLTIDSSDIRDGKERQGLFETYLGTVPAGEKLPGDERKLEIKPTTAFRRRETPAYYNTITKKDTEETVYRTFKLNIPGSTETRDEYVDVTIFKKEAGTWQTSPLPR